ncbi:PREDICTED: cilia- and flagella-associated protein 20-like [Dinoponera quadriceps]|uniref:Cilia- and flagella-associated protein 20-like n=1 Tax=Dinoponera quadriceps TaxID=609295 RepID=A0A6P3X7W7_DINQU|nr:PREDICTED: cilia- and flagella-associated protein 20-like [Dinoponera quadriceps]
MSSDPNCGYISLLCSIANKPLDLWSKHVSLDGQVRRVSDDELHGDKVIEILGPRNSVVPTSITAPAKILDTLNIRLAILVLVIKNLQSYFKLEVQVQVMQDALTEAMVLLLKSYTSMARIPLKLEECWNTLEINLQTLCHMAYGTDYEALLRIIVYPNCRLRRVYLQDRHYNRNETSAELYNAFLDAFMSKWRINFVEQTCQTEECYTGSTYVRSIGV